MKFPEISLQVLKIIKKNLEYQNSKGMRKYGLTIDDVEYEEYDWNVMVIEELVDGIQYVVKENQKLYKENQELMRFIEMLGKGDSWNEKYNRERDFQ